MNLHNEIKYLHLSKLGDVKAHLNIENPPLEELLINAAKKGYMEIVALLLKLGVNPTVGNGIVFSCACYGGDLEIVKLLLKAKADPRANDNSALHSAEANGYPDIAEFLYEQSRYKWVQVSNDE